ncbi:ABC transporter ATP-binding protein [Paenibacillus sp. TRM 82003]|uniref:ABC transporter ATP-binding protein n=1 Tax=Kineococcus sp. TRM81007 TaxID=2925831 RepID=UPI001F56ADB8|nr:ABC transporter ATP-binding protein [Kineococcus sp. TRM81007]MCI2238242.1 ABC transporter ATP-binding protein [Kineococcus sp. TRM81007]MCI3924086.1 ABC transporter ATP-binding protein [Paenibacillus sp. TRM 82003]
MTTTDAPAIECSGLSKGFGEVRALDGLTVAFTAPATGLLGANGAGKSTFMRVALGLVRPDSGTLRVLGMDAARERGEVRRRVGFMPEHPCLPLDMSAQEVCVHLARLRGLGRRDAVRRASEVLFAVGLEEERRRPVGTYSLGMQQRTKLAQALVHGPELVLLDEPTSGLDPAGREEMLQLVRRLSRDLGVRVVTSSHVLDDVERTCDEVVVLRAGALAAQRPVAVGHDPGGAVHVRVGGDPVEFAAALAPRLEPLGVRAAPTPTGDVGISAGTDAALDAVRDLAAEQGRALVRLVADGRGLEDVVLDAMEGRGERTGG